MTTDGAVLPIQISPVSRHRPPPHWWAQKEEGEVRLMTPIISHVRDNPVPNPYVRGYSCEGDITFCGYEVGNRAPRGVTSRSWGLQSLKALARHHFLIFADSP